MAECVSIARLYDTTELEPVVCFGDGLCIAVLVVIPFVLDRVIEGHLRRRRFGLDVNLASIG